MKHRSVIGLLWFGAGALALGGLVFLTVMQQKTVSRLQTENRTLRENTKELERLRAEIEEARHLQNQEAEIQQLRENNRELLRLRNEVRQFRELREETDLMRAANAQLLQLLDGLDLSSNQQAQVVAVRQRGAALGIYARSVGDSGNGTPSASAGSGVVVLSIDPHSPAAGSGLNVGDIIARLDGRPIETFAQLKIEMMTKKPGETIVLDVVRNGGMARLTVEVQAWPQ
jgi:C-terminal processing protease CtpA/Prc